MFGNKSPWFYNFFTALTFITWLLFYISRHDFFLEHVMSHSPGFGKLVSWSPVPVMPTPAAVGDIVKAYGTKNGINVLCADIGGATTDLFSLFRDTTGNPSFNRTVSANLGMSYSIADGLVESGAEAIKRRLAA